MLAGQIGVVTGAVTPFDKVVSWATKSPAVHAVVAISETECMSMESEGATIASVDSWPNRIIWSKFELTDEQRQGIVDWAMARKGKPYAWLDDFIIGIHDLTGWRIPPVLAERLSGDKRYQCSELSTCALFYGAGIRIFPRMYPGEVSPGDLLNYFIEQGWVNDDNGEQQGLLPAMQRSQALADKTGD